MADIAGESAALPGHRGRKRSSMMLMGTIKAIGDEPRESQPIRIRNLSSDGLMAVSKVVYRPGEKVEIGLRGVDIIPGEIVWVDDDRMGIVFHESIDMTQVNRQP